MESSALVDAVRSLLQDLLAIENVQVKAICDLVPEKVREGAKGGHDRGPTRTYWIQQGRKRFRESDTSSNSTSSTSRLHGTGTFRWRSMP